MKKFFYTFVLVCAIVCARAQDCIKDEHSWYLRGLCDHVISPDYYEGKVFSYVYKLKKAAGVTAEDSEELIAEKIRKMWAKYEDCMVCDTPAFSVVGGNILKAATISSNRAFFDYVLDWKVNLNRIDPADNRTVLDYIRDEINKKPHKIQFYKTYYGILRENGAKHAAEILAEKNTK